MLQGMYIFAKSTNQSPKYDHSCLHGEQSVKHWGELSPLLLLSTARAPRVTNEFVEAPEHAIDSTGEELVDAGTSFFDGHRRTPPFKRPDWKPDGVNDC